MFFYELCPMLFQATIVAEQISETAPTTMIGSYDAVFITAIAALVTAIAAIIAPVITAIISQRGARKLKSIELFYTSKSEAYTQFLSAATHHFLTSFNYDDAYALLNTSAAVLLYSSEDTQEKVNEYCRALVAKEAGEDNSAELGVLHKEVILALQKEIQEFKK